MFTATVVWTKAGLWLLEGPEHAVWVPVPKGPLVHLRHGAARRMWLVLFTSGLGRRPVESADFGQSTDLHRWYDRLAEPLSPGTEGRAETEPSVATPAVVEEGESVVATKEGKRAGRGKPIERSGPLALGPQIRKTGPGARLTVDPRPGGVGDLTLPDPPLPVPVGDDDFDDLRRHPLVDDDTRLAWALWSVASGAVAQAQPLDVMFRADHGHRGVRVLLQGAVEIDHDGLLRRRIEAPGVVGEIEVLGLSQTHLRTAQVVSPARYLFVDEQSFLAVGAVFPSLFTNLARMVGRKFLDAMKDLEVLARADTSKS